MNNVTLRGVLLWPVLPTFAVILVSVFFSPNGEVSTSTTPWTVIFYEVCVLAWAFWRTRSQPTALLELFRPQRAREHVALAGWAILAYLCLAIGGERVLNVFWTSLLEALGLPLPGPPALNPSSWDEMAMFVILAVVLAPIIEEFLLRGLTFRVLRRWWGLIPGLLGQAIIFGFLHDQGMLWKVLLGVFLGILALRSGSLFISWATHLSINLLATLAVTAGLLSGTDPAMADPSVASDSDTGGVEVFFFAVGLWAAYRFFHGSRSAWNPRTRTPRDQRFLWTLVRKHSRRPWPRGRRAPPRFLRRAELPRL